MTLLHGTEETMAPKAGKDMTRKLKRKKMIPPKKRSTQREMAQQGRNNTPMVMRGDGTMRVASGSMVAAQEEDMPPPEDMMMVLEGDGMVMALRKGMVSTGTGNTDNTGVSTQEEVQEEVTSPQQGTGWLKKSVNTSIQELHTQHQQA
jgi:hypothetical protein